MCIFAKKTTNKIIFYEKVNYVFAGNYYDCSNV